MHDEGQIRPAPVKGVRIGAEENLPEFPIRYPDDIFVQQPLILEEQLDKRSMAELKHYTRDVTCHDDDTLHKVRGALLKVGLTTSEALDCIREMQNAGILFRERI